MVSQQLELESTLQEIQLYDFHLESTCLAKEAALIFETNAVLPGIIVMEHGELLGIISRRRFLECMSRPYGLEIFLKRPLKVLYSFVHTEPLIFAGDTLIVTAARCALQREPEFLYEPIVVQLLPKVYQILNMQDLLIAQSKIHELTIQLLQKQTQSKIMQTEKLASLGRMIAGVAHEILNPVNFIFGNLGPLSDYSQSLLEILSAYDAELPQPSRKISELKESLDLDFIRRDLPQVIESMTVGTDQLMKIIRSFRSFSHMDENRLQEVNIHDCMESTLLILNSRLKMGIKVIKNYGQLPPVNGYSGQLSQVFMNLLSNAIDALMDKAERQTVNTEFPSDGSTIIKQADNWQPQIQISTEVRVTEPTNLSNSRWVAVRISDNGSGIPPELQQRIFETFFTTKPVGKGTGLGLAISHQIVTEKHQGQLNLRSQLGVGTEFEILLPLA